MVYLARDERYMSLFFHLFWVYLFFAFVYQDADVDVFQTTFLYATGDKSKGENGGNGRKGICYILLLMG